MGKYIYAKTATYGVMHFIVAFIVALVVSRDLHIALSISLIEPVVQIFFFLAHEKIWHKYAHGEVVVGHDHGAGFVLKIWAKIKTAFMHK